MKWHKQHGRWSIEFGWFRAEEKTPLLSLDILCQHDHVDLLTILGVQIVKLCFAINANLAHGK